MQSRILALLLACSIAAAMLPARAARAGEGDLPKRIAQAAKFECGQNVEPLQRLEQLVRESAGKPALRAELEAGLVKLLAPSATFEARRFACQWLNVVGTDASLPALADLLKDDETAGIACLALSGRRSPKADAMLRNALPSVRGRTRIQVIVALGNRQDAESVPALAGLARNADVAVAEAAILALGKIGAPAAHETIAALRKEAKPAQARAVTEATLLMARQLAAAGNRKGAAAIYTELLQPPSAANIRRGALAALMELDEDGGRQRILDILEGRDPALVPAAIARVASLKAEGTSQRFAAMLPGLPPQARAWMIEALAVRGDKAAIAAIRAEVSSSEAVVRRTAIAAVGKLDDAPAVPLLSKMLASAKTPEERQEAEVALSMLRGGAATDLALIAELRQSPTEMKVRLCTVLARRGARAAVPALVAEAGSPDAAAAQAALRALGRMAAAEDLPALLETLTSLKAVDARPDAESAAARAMAKIAERSRRSEAILAALAKDASVEARRSFLRLLPKAADARALAALTSACRDTDPWVRDAAIRALATWPDATAWSALLAVVQQSENDVHRALALGALTRLVGDLNAKPDAVLIERYRRLLAGAKRDNERKAVLGALAGAAHPDALQLALPLLSNPGVRAEAELAVRKIAQSIKAQHPQAARAALERLKQANP